MKKKRVTRRKPASFAGVMAGSMATGVGLGALMQIKQEERINRGRTLEKMYDTQHEAIKKIRKKARKKGYYTPSQKTSLKNLKKSFKFTGSAKGEDKVSFPRAVRIHTKRKKYE